MEITTAGIVDYVQNPPGGRFLTLEHVLLPHTLDPSQTIVDSGISYLAPGVTGFGIGALAGYLLGRDTMKWAKWGAGINLSFMLVGRVGLLTAADRLRESGWLQEAIANLPQEGV